MYKVLIVDDEPLIRKGMLSIIDWAGCGLKVAALAASGEEAIDRFLEDPAEIVITDIRMPGMNGLELIATIRSIDPNAKLIVLSGFDDFQYVKEGIRFGIENYLLKPVDVNELVATLKGAVIKLGREGNRKMQADEERQILRNNVLIRWVTRTIPVTELKHRAELADIPLAHRAYTVVKAYVHRLDRSEEGVSHDIKTEIVAELLRIVQEMIPGSASGYEAMVFVDAEGDIVIIYSDQTGQLEREIISKDLEKVHCKIREAWLVDVLFSIGTTVESYADVHESYRKAAELQNRSLIRGWPYIAGEQRARRNAQQIELISDRLALLSMLAKGNAADLRRWVDEAFDRLRAIEGVSLADAQNGAMEIIIQVNRQRRMNSLDTLAELVRLRDMEQIRQHVQSFIQDSLEASSREEDELSPVVRKVLQHIHVYYASELSLKTLSQVYNIHPVYLGQLFKKEKGVGFTDYVNGYRVQIAKELLLNTDLRANEIALKIGYTDPNYFYKLFAKLTGVSPTDFRAT